MNAGDRLSAPSSFRASLPSFSAAVFFGIGKLIIFSILYYYEVSVFFHITCRLAFSYRKTDILEEGRGSFNARSDVSACCEYEGEIRTDVSAQCQTVPTTLSAASRTHGTFFFTELPVQRRNH